MVSINLLRGQQQYERQMRRRSKLQLFIGALVLAGVSVVWGWVVVDGNRAVQRLEQEVQAKQARVASLQTTHRQVLKLKERRQTLVAERDKLKTLTNELHGPVRLLSIISRIVDPLDVWLMHLQAENERVILSGFARSLDDVLKLAKDFEKTELLGPVDVFKVEPRAGQPDLFQFSMNVFMDSTDHGRRNS